MSGAPCVEERHVAATAPILVRPRAPGLRPEGGPRPHDARAHDADVRVGGEVGHAFERVGVVGAELGLPHLQGLLLQRQCLGDHATHGQTDDVGAVDAFGVQYRHGIGRHQRVLQQQRQVPFSADDDHTQQDGLEDHG